jgi:hypothetical protein
MAQYKKRDNKPAELIRTQLEELLRQGSNVAEALQIVGRSRSWYEGQRRTDRDWATKIDAIRNVVSNPDLRQMQVGEFAEFCEEYLGRKIWPHQQNMIDILEGREPAWVHPSMIYEPGSRGSKRVLINIPPNHAKSMTITIEYVTYRLAKNPNLKVMIVSKTQDQAKKFLYAIKQRMTHPRYAKFQLAFGPPEGWRAASDQWSATKVYLGGEAQDGSKDPSVEAVGMGGQIYGNRADLIILDDTVTLANAGQWESQMDWIRQEVASRLSDGQLLVVGTRVAPMDLYRELRNPDHYADSVVPWSYLAMPAVLKYADSEDDWQTLWPVTDEPMSEADEPVSDGVYPRWTGKRLAQVRNEVGATKWSLIYQQQDVEENATFDAVAVRGCVNGRRTPAPLNPNLAAHPDNIDGFYTICAMDPAIAGDCAAVALSVDRQTGKRWVLDMRVISSPTPMQIRELISEMTEVYQPSEWVIEENAFQGYLSQDEILRQYLANKGIVLRPHHTGSNKMDPDFGVASMSGLFGTVAQDPKTGLRQHQKDNLIELPTATAPGVRLLVEQLVSWSPAVKTKHRKQDTVMALWFAELSARRVLSSARKHQTWHMPNKMLSDRDKTRQMVINLDEWAESQSVYL